MTHGNGVGWLSYNHFGLHVLCEVIPSLKYKASEIHKRALRTSVYSVAI